MKKRCINKNHKSYHHYGGRGVTICDSWIDSFEAFLSDMGKRPSKNHSLDRIDNNGGYYKDNCRWASKTEQARNQRTNRLLTHNGETKCFQEWANILGMSWSGLYYKLYQAEKKDTLGGLLANKD